jgi:hypothetical protein
MEDMRKRLDQQDTILHGVRGDTQLQAQALQRVELGYAQVGKDVATILLHLGKEEEDGQGNYMGTGLLGRVRRVERSQRTLRELYHRWIAFGAGFSGCLGGAVVIIWWLLGDKLAIVLKGTGHG